MRLARFLGLALALVLVPAVAVAGPVDDPLQQAPWRDVVVHGALHKPPAGAPQKPVALTSASRILYLNNCMPNGCDVFPGWDDSRTNRSSIPPGQAHQAPYRWGQGHWNQLVQCMRDTFAPFDIQIVTDDPGPSVNHFEVMIAGDDSQIYPGALGVAPFVPCNGQLEDNVISFVFADLTSSIDQLCWAAAQEPGHVFGMDHELEARDPMTYLYPPAHKEFTDVAADCGENTPRQCWCGEFKQNSYQYMMDTFGPRIPVAPTIAITRPTEGQWVRPGFNVFADIDAQVSIDEALLSVDGATSGSVASEPFVFNTPADLPGGPHQITVQATSLGLTAMASVNVNVTARCDDGDCEDGFACLGGYCLPAADTPGGLGAACADDAACITGECWQSGDVKLCSSACDADRECPDGFECQGEGEGVCWPGEGGGKGGCAAGGGGNGGGLIFAGLAAALALSRRRRQAG